MSRVPCQECRDGIVTEIRAYAAPLLGDAMFESSKTAWPIREPGSFELTKVKVQRDCCRCGGTGERVVVE